MPRKPRIDIPGLLYHVTVRGIERRRIFYSEKDREDFLLRLIKNTEGQGTKVYAWSLMPNHVHLLIKTGERPLNRIMRKILTGYAVNFNIRHRRAGHLFQNRYKSIVCNEEGYLLELVRYIHLNPLRAKIVKDMRELSGYKWSGHAVIMGKIQREWQEVSKILERFGKTQLTARKNYAKFVEDGIKDGKRKDLAGGGLIRSKGGMFGVILDRSAGIREQADDRVLGTGEFVENILKSIEKKEEIKVKTKKELTIGQLIKNASSYFEVSERQLRGKSSFRKLTKARAVLVSLAVEYLDMNSSKIREELGLSFSGISRLYYKGEKILKENLGIADNVLGRQHIVKIGNYVP